MIKPMLFDRDVQICVYPDKFSNDVYDIAKIFYSGAIHRRQALSSADNINAAAASSVTETAPAEDAPLCIDKINVFIDENQRIVELWKNITSENSQTACRHEPTARAQIDADTTSGSSLAYSIKITLYRLLKAQATIERGANIHLPWGALVGIRPVKLYTDLLEKGLSGPGIKLEMSRLYDVSDEASRLCLEVAANQNALLQGYDAHSDCLLYIGVPFCISKCAYCSFPSDAHNKAEIYAARYIDALLIELSYIAGSMKGTGRLPRAVYIGGGTPTALAPRELTRLLHGFADAFRDAYPDEITVEAGRADTIDAEKLSIIKSLAQKTRRLRLCINPQTMNPRTLSIIKRAHTPGDVVKAFWLSREAGFEDINMDIIAGLPGEGIDDFNNTLEAISKLRPDSITSHTLCVKRSSRINEFHDQYIYPDAAATHAMQDAADECCRCLGMSPYYLYRQKNTIGNLANIGFAAPGRECAYNIHEMADRVDVYAAGAGAVSKFVDHKTGCIQRVFNVKNLLEYISRNDEMIIRKQVYMAD